MPQPYRRLRPDVEVPVVGMSAVALVEDACPAVADVFVVDGQGPAGLVARSATGRSFRS